MASRKFCEIEISWNPGSDANVHDVVIYNIESDTYEDNNKLQSADAVDLFLKPPPANGDNATIPCTATVTCTHAGSNLAIAAVDILSNARNIEVFSPTGEYLITAEGIKLDVAGERKLFLSQHTFDEAQPMCSLKFVSLVDPDKLWLHSLHITLGKNTSQPQFPLQMGPMIDMEKVSNMVADMDGEIPDRAKGLMTAITSMQKSKESNLSSLGGFLGRSGVGGVQNTQGMSGLIGMFASLGLMSSVSHVKPESPVQTVPNELKSKSKKSKKEKTQKSVSSQEQVQNSKKDISTTSKVAKDKQNDNNEKRIKNSQKVNSQQGNTNKAPQENLHQGRKKNKKKKKQKHVEGLHVQPPSLSIPQNDVTPSNSSYNSEASDLNDVQTESTCSSSGSSTKGLSELQALEQRLCARIKSTEDALKQNISEQIAASEKRIIDHINGLVGRLSTAMLGLPLPINDDVKKTSRH